MTDVIQTAVLGAGNWGTTLARLIAGNGHPVRLWTRDRDRRDEINTRHTNERSLPGHSLPPSVIAVTSMEEALSGAQLVFLVLPSQSFREVCREAGRALLPDQLVVHATKGLESVSHKRMTEILLGETCARQLGVLAGPNIANEIAAGKPAATVITSRFPRLVATVQRAVRNERLMVFSSDDVLGVEIAGALKNVVAIAAGMAAEMELGENARAFLVTRGMSEIARVGRSLGAHPLTFAGLAGFGDLVVTCSSPLSRNNRVGRALARGEPLQEILSRLGMVAEGVYAAASARELAALHGVDVPLLTQVHRVLFEGAPVRECLARLMALEGVPDAGALTAGARAIRAY